MVAIYAGDILRIYRERRRKVIELNSRASIGAFVSLIAATVLFIALLAAGRLDTGSGAVIYLVTFGWLTGMGLAQLYKIVPFMTWLECYGPALGRMPTPRVQDLVTEASALRWFRLYYLTVALGTLALLIGSAILSFCEFRPIDCRQCARPRVRANTATDQRSGRTSIA